MNGKKIYELAGVLWDIPRSITGDGVRQTLSIIRQILPNLKKHEVPTGTKVLDWEIPQEWNIQDAYIIDPDGRKIVDFKENNLHVLNYSLPIDEAHGRWMSTGWQGLRDANEPTFV